MMFKLNDQLQTQDDRAYALKQTIAKSDAASSIAQSLKAEFLIDELLGRNSDLDTKKQIFVSSTDLNCVDGEEETNINQHTP